jgi:hypothetical protein
MTRRFASTEDKARPLFVRREKTCMTFCGDRGRDQIPRSVATRENKVAAHPTQLARSQSRASSPDTSRLEARVSTIPASRVLAQTSFVVRCHGETVPASQATRMYIYS